VGPEVIVIPSPVEDRFFEVAPPSASTTLRVAVIGRLAPWKGQDLAITALARLCGPTVSEPIDATLVIAGTATFGEDDYAHTLPELAETLGVSDRVEFRGFVADVAALLADIDVVVLSSRSPEPFGNVVVEAMAAARAVVVPNRGGVTEFVIAEGPGANGIFYESSNVESLALALTHLAKDPDRRRVLGTRARESARAFRAEPMAHRLEDVYDSLV
jgi:glycosyltransferase involved in cell wall biosynthesis